jgi:tRNA G18 (ribose-2'-O)-methylase SpoU
MSELNRLTVEEFKASEKIPVVVVLDNIRSLNNIGSVFRTADAFRLAGIILCGITAVPPHREIHKTALGATESVSWSYYERTTDAIKQMIDEGYRIIAVEQTEGSIHLNNFHPEPGWKLAFLFGNEVNGIDENALQMIHECIEIPQFGTKHSINVSVAVGIVIWDVLSKLKFPGMK